MKIVAVLNRQSWLKTIRNRQKRTEWSSLKRCSFAESRGKSQRIRRSKQKRIFREVKVDIKPIKTKTKQKQKMSFPTILWPPGKLIVERKAVNYFSDGTCFSTRYLLFFSKGVQCKDNSKNEQVVQVLLFETNKSSWHTFNRNAPPLKPKCEKPQLLLPRPRKPLA